MGLGLLSTLHSYAEKNHSLSFRKISCPTHKQSCTLLATKILVNHNYYNYCYIYIIIIHFVSSILSRRKSASRGGSTLRSISGGKWCPHGHTSPTVKHTPAKERKVHHSGGPYPCSDLRISHSLHYRGSPPRT